MAGNEIRYELTLLSAAADDIVKLHPKALEQFERRLCHELQNRVFSMLRSHFQTAGSMFEDQLLKIWI